MTREILADGAVRLRSARACFVFTRLRPGALWVVATGRDGGELGDEPVAELSAELARFPLELALFIDAARVEHVSRTARTWWMQWLEAQRSRLRDVHMLVSSRFVHFTVAMAGHESGTRIGLHDHEPSFTAAVQAEVPGWDRRPEQVLEAPAIPITRETDGDRAVVLDDGACAFSLRALARDALLIRIRGRDRGVLASAVFDEIARACPDAGRLHLFMDLRATCMPPAAVSELWAAWLAANRARLASVVLLAPAFPLYVTVSIAQWRSRTGPLVRVVEDASRFDAAIQRVVPAFPGLAAQP